MSVTEFYQLSPIEFYYSMEAYSDERMDEKKTAYEVMRLQTFFLLNIQLAKKDKIKEVQKLMPFPWDKEKINNVVPKQSVEEMKVVLKNIVQAFKKK
jgi:hypothetical protein